MLSRQVKWGEKEHRERGRRMQGDNWIPRWPCTVGARKLGEQKDNRKWGTQD